MQSEKGPEIMARSARSAYVAPDENAIFFIRCRTTRALILPPDQRGSAADTHRVRYIEDLIRHFASHFGVAVHAHAVTQREMRLVLQSRPDVVAAMDDTQIARCWLSICPTLRRGRGRSGEPTEEEVLALRSNPSRIAQIRNQISNISWWMRLLKQRITQLCNREEDTEGSFWVGRYRAVLLLDGTAHLAALANVDLAAVDVRDGQPVSASIFTSALYRQADSQDSGTLQPDSVQAGRLERENGSAQVLMPAPPEETEDIAQAPSAFAATLHATAPTPAVSVESASPDTPDRPCSRHLSPIRHSDEAADTVPLAAGFQHSRCSDDSALNMTLSDYRKLLAYTHRGCHAELDEGHSSEISPQISELQLTDTAWVHLVGCFDDLFSHVAGRPAEMDAYIPRSGRPRAYVRPAARALFRSASAF